ncbi:MAG TPA: ATP synthase F1 subunit gamma [Candidatus Saccharimonadales bacterium]|nr:ATP synthase F1 subunit gamma [Candidatus Saccharimonadales bacterium]
MPSRQQIKRRIGSVRNTRQITKAMQLVSASKLRRIQAAVQATQAYSKYARELLTYLKSQHGATRFDFYRERPVKRRLLMLVTSDRGLAGAYNANAIKLYLREVKKDQDAGIKTQTIAFGRQGANLVSRLKDADVLGTYTGLPDSPSLGDLQAAIDTAINAFKSGQVDAVDIIYTNFVSTITQQTAVQRMLPAGFTEETVSEAIRASEFEPSMEEVLMNTTIRLLESQVLQAVLESIVSEQAMRMLAMKNATDNASDIIDDLTLVYNNARQAAITQELAEITGGAEALK